MKNILLDATVLLHNPRAIFAFPNCNVLIPIEVIEEIDAFKRDMDERGRNSRTAAQILDELRAHGRLGEGVRLENGAVLRVVCEPVAMDLPALAGSTAQSEARILAVALQAARRSPEAPTCIVTKNINLRIKADALGLPAEDYEEDRTPEVDVYTGWSRVRAPETVVQRLNRGHSARFEGIAGVPNEYLLVEAEDPEARGAAPPALGRVAPDEPGKILPVPGGSVEVAGIQPLNLEQRFAFDALLAEDIRLVTLTGKAGTGKTLLAIAAGLHKVFVEDRYNRVLIFRPTLPVSRDIGFLPGDIEEKMRPWMQPVYDALELLREQDRRKPKKSLPPDVMECEELRIEPLTYIRGRSIPHQYIIIDEAQNLTPLEVKTVITRVGKGTKVVLTGDPHQIDNPFVDALSNGLSYLVGHLRASALTAHIALSKGERSELAEAAANLL